MFRCAAVIVCVICTVVACTGAETRREEAAAAALSVASLIESGDYVVAERAARQHADAVRRATGEQSRESIAAIDLVVGALVANGKGSSEEAGRLSALAVERRQEWLGARHPHLVPALRNRSQVVGDLSNSEAVDLLTRALAIQEAAATPPLELARTLDLLSRALERTDRVDDAIRTAERSVAITATLAGLPRTGAEPRGAGLGTAGERRLRRGERSSGSRARVAPSAGRGAPGDCRNLVAALVSGIRAGALPGSAPRRIGRVDDGAANPSPRSPIHRSCHEVAGGGRARSVGPRSRRRTVAAGAGDGGAGSGTESPRDRGVPEQLGQPYLAAGGLRSRTRTLRPKSGHPPGGVWRAARIRGHGRLQPRARRCQPW